MSNEMIYITITVIGFFIVFPSVLWQTI